MKLSKLYISLIILAIVALIIYLLSTKNSARPISLSDSKPKVAVSIFPIYDLARNIAGDKVEVVLLLPPGSSPHTYEPSVEQAVSLTGSRALFIVGHGLDDWGKQISKTADIPPDRLIVLDKYIKLISSQDDHTDEVAGFDPHYWLSVDNARLISRQIAEDLSVIFPQYASEFTQNLTGYTDRLSALDTEIESKLSRLKQKDIATFHHAWAYFGRDHGINIVTTFEEFPGEEPTADYLAGFQSQIRQSGIKAIFSEPQFSTKPLQSIADDLGISISQLDPIGGSGNLSSYESLIRYNLQQLVDALSQ